MVVKLDLPRGWAGFRLPPALQDRLNELLDRQDQGQKLTVRERKEAKALVELVDMLTVLKAHSQAKPKS